VAVTGCKAYNGLDYETTEKRTARRKPFCITCLDLYLKVYLVLY